jgi:hypothetical protein
MTSKYASFANKMVYSHIGKQNIYIRISADNKSQNSNKLPASMVAAQVASHIYSQIIQNERKDLLHL